MVRLGRRRLHLEGALQRAWRHHRSCSPLSLPHFPARAPSYEYFPLVLGSKVKRARVPRQEPLYGVPTLGLPFPSVPVAGCEGQMCTGAWSFGRTGRGCCFVCCWCWCWLLAGWLHDAGGWPSTENVSGYRDRMQAASTPARGRITGPAIIGIGNSGLAVAGSGHRQAAKGN